MKTTIARREAAARLNPFMNQVYFYRERALSMHMATSMSLNPFMNQVYFYTKYALGVLGGLAAES